MPMRDCHRDTGGNQCPLSGCQFDVLGAVQINAGVAVVGPGGHGEVAVQANHREAGGHDRKDYPWRGVCYPSRHANRAVSRAAVGAVVVVADRRGIVGGAGHRGHHGRPDAAPVAALRGAGRCGRRHPAVAQPSRGTRGRNRPGHRIVGRRGAPAGFGGDSLGRRPPQRQIGGAGPSARSGRLRPAPQLGGVDGVGGPRRPG